MKEQIEQQILLYKKEIVESPPTSIVDVEEWRIRFLGSKGILKQWMGLLKQVPTEDKKILGQLLNDFKTDIEQKISQWHEQYLPHTSITTKTEEDWTLPAFPMMIGARHPLSIVKNKIIRTFQQLGFAIAEGPEIEDDWHNFGAMNLNENHPARDMQDTFYLQKNPDWLLRTHTSSVQARVMETQKPPIRVICPGRVYRNETISARAHCFFHQVEGLYIDKEVSFADLKQTLYFFVQEIFGSQVKIQFRPSYFPFTEPSAEMDIQCLLCEGAGCSLCKHSGWVEILGSGMVHPQVLKNCHINPDIYTGFAFGLGVERICQILYRINDLRLYAQNDLRFLKQFIKG